jgi:hypothetical protein
MSRYSNVSPTSNDMPPEKTQKKYHGSSGNWKYKSETPQALHHAHDVAEVVQANQKWLLMVDNLQSL